MDRVQFQVVVPSEVADEIDLRGDADLQVTPATADDRAGLKLGLEVAAAVMTIVVGGVELTKVCVSLAKSLIAWYRRRRSTGHSAMPLTITVRGSRRDGVLAIDDDTDEQELADEIKRTASA